MLFREAWVIGEIQQKNPSLDYGVVPIPSWKAGEPHKMLLQPWGIYVNGKSGNQQDGAWDFLRFLTNRRERLPADQHDRLGLRTTGRRLEPLLQKMPQFEVFVSAPKDVSYYVEPSYRCGTRSRAGWRTG